MHAKQPCSNCVVDEDRRLSAPSSPLDPTITTAPITSE
jgi:hypothetical protein